MFTIDVLTLFPEVFAPFVGLSIIGRAVIVHEKADDLKTQPSGNAGARFACGVIGVANPKPPMPK